MGKVATFTSCSARGFITKDDKLLLVKEKGERAWETPGGRIQETDKSPAETCQREVLEETGYKVNVQNILDVCIHTFENEKRVFHIIYKCELKDKIKKSGPDIEDMKWFSKLEVEKLLEQNQADFHDKNIFEIFIKGKI